MCVTPPSLSAPQILRALCTTTDHQCCVTEDLGLDRVAALTSHLWECVQEPQSSSLAEHLEIANQSRRTIDAVK